MYSESNVEQLIVFRVASYLFALPVKEVLQVVNCPPQTSYEVSQLGLVQLGQHMIKVVDLHRQCNSGNFSQLLNGQLFLVITRNPQGGFCGIPVCEPPDLIELPSDRLRSLPPSEQPFGVLQIVSRVAVLTQRSVTTTIFLLDMQQALTANLPDSQLLPSEV